MLKIYLTRHGQNVDNINGVLNGHRDLPLTEKGLEQAREIGLRIKESGLTFDAVYASPLQRAFVTAQTIAAVADTQEPQEEDLLIERDLGVMSGELIADIPRLAGDKILKADPITYFLEADGAETFPDLVVRGKALLAKIAGLHPEGSVLLVSHGDVGKMIYAAYYDLDWKSVLVQFHFGNCDLLLLSPDSPPEQAHVFQLEQYNH